MNAWDLFRKTFKEGEEIFVVGEYDEIYWGKLKNAKGGIKAKTFFLIQLNGTEKELDWSNMRFFSHDGFPVRKLKGADGNTSIEELNTSNILKAIIVLATQEQCPACSNFVNKSSMVTPRNPRIVEDGHVVDICKKCNNSLQQKMNDIRLSIRNGLSMVFGDPFLIEDVFIKVFNPGNNTPEFWNSQLEESLLLSAVDGSKALIYDTPTIYYLGN